MGGENTASGAEAAHVNLADHQSYEGHIEQSKHLAIKKVLPFHGKWKLEASKDKTRNKIFLS